MLVTKVLEPDVFNAKHISLQSQDESVTYASLYDTREYFPIKGIILNNILKDYINIYLSFQKTTFALIQQHKLHDMYTVCKFHCSMWDIG